MSNLEEKIEQLRNIDDSRDGSVDYMSDMKNWVCVHATRYEPEQNAEGELCIKTTAMATGYKLPRATVHLTLNQVVGSHLFGNWDAMPIVVLAPYNEVVGKNGNPQEVAVEDTYFIPNPDTGLVLPDSAYVVRPDPHNEELFKIGEHGATYKTDNYTKEEEEAILALSPWEREKYQKYLSGDIPEYEVKSTLDYDEKLIQIYEKSKDKQAFMRGIFEEKRFAILNNLLRDAVVKMALEKMGYRYVFAHEDYVSEKVADVAKSAGLRGNSGNKGHFASVEREMDIVGCSLLDLSEVLQSKKIDKIYDYLTSGKPMCKEIIANIVSDTGIPDFYKSFETAFNDNLNQKKEWYEIDKKCYGFDESREKIWQVAISRMENGIKGYNPFLDTTLRRHSKRMKLECVQALKVLQQDRENFADLKQRLIAFNMQKEKPKTLLNRQKGGR